MGPVYAFMLLAVLIGGSALATDKANGAELPDEVIRIHSEIQVYNPEPHLFKEYLRHPGHESFLIVTPMGQGQCLRFRVSRQSIERLHLTAVISYEWSFKI